MKYTGDQDLPTVDEEDFSKARETMRRYTAVVLRPGRADEAPGPDRTADLTATIMAHGKRHYALHQAGLLSIVCPVADGSEIVGLSLFNADPDEVDRIMANDPAVQAHILAYDIHPTWSFPGSTLP